MASLKSHQLRASSLIEVTVSMVMVILVFSLALMIYINVTHKGSSLRKIKYTLLLQDMALRTKREKSFFDQTLTLDQAIVEKKVLPYAGNKHLLILSIQVKNQDEEVMSSQQELIYVPYEEN